MKICDVAKTVFCTFLHFVQVKIAPERRQPEDLFFPSINQECVPLKSSNRDITAARLALIMFSSNGNNGISSSKPQMQIKLPILGCRVNQRLTLGIVKLCPIAIFPLCRALTLQYIGCIGVTFYTTDPWYCEAVVPFSQYFLFSGLTMVAFV